MADLVKRYFDKKWAEYRTVQTGLTALDVERNENERKKIFIGRPYWVLLPLALLPCVLAFFGKFWLFIGLLCVATWVLISHNATVDRLQKEREEEKRLNPIPWEIYESMFMTGDVVSWHEYEEEVEGLAKKLDKWAQVGFINDFEKTLIMEPYRMQFDEFLKHKEINGSLYGAQKVRMLEIYKRRYKLGGSLPDMQNYFKFMYENLKDSPDLNALQKKRLYDAQTTGRYPASDIRYI